MYSDYKKNEEFDLFCEEEEEQHEIPHHNSETSATMVIANLILQVDLSYLTVFPNPILEIVDVKKKVAITRCRLLLPTNQLFLKGFIRKSISYTDGFNIHGLIEHIPFEKIVQLENYVMAPILPKMNTNHVSDYFIYQPLPAGCSNHDEMSTNDHTHIQQHATHHYNNPTACELLQSTIVESSEPCTESNESPSLAETAVVTEKLFSRVVNNIAMNLTMNVIQNQPITLSR